jgi:redox-sensitive bicupin YhaK (pirin superfamily)
VIDAHITPRVRDIGDGFEVRRALPAAERRTIGPFVFFDQMGPVLLPKGKGVDVRPHPHIGLATVTYLFEGEILHRDSLGTVQAIRPGEVNWMTAGKGIVHSERTPPALREAGSRIFGIQTWVGLPRVHEETEPSFAHHASLPALDVEGVVVRLILGNLHGQAAPVRTLSEVFYADAIFAPDTRFVWRPETEERGAYVVDGTVEVAGTAFKAGEMLAFRRDAEVEIKAARSARLMLLGGAPLDGHRHLLWNFVSSRKERNEQAAADWKAGRFPSVPGDAEFIPFPERAPGVVNYP